MNLSTRDSNFESCLSDRHDCGDDSAAAAAASPTPAVAAPTMIHVVSTLAAAGGGGMGEVRALAGYLLT